MNNFLNHLNTRKYTKTRKTQLSVSCTERFHTGIMPHEYKCRVNKYASYLDWRISPHADPPRLSQRWLTRRSASSPASLSHLARDCPMRYQHFHFLALGANPLAKVHKNRRRPDTHPDLPSCQISSPCLNPRRRYPLQNFCRQTSKQ